MSSCLPRMVSEKAIEGLLDLCHQVFTLKRLFTTLMLVLSVPAFAWIFFSTSGEHCDQMGRRFQYIRRQYLVTLPLTIAEESWETDCDSIENFLNIPQLEGGQ